MSISTRIKEFIDKKYLGNNSALARDLHMKPQALQVYLLGSSIPGGILLTKLAELGCDINYLLLGKDGVSKVREQSVEYKAELAGIHSEIEELKKVVQELQAHNYILMVNNEKLEKENTELMKSEALLRGEVLQLNSVNDKLEKNNKIKG
ncbi:MAG: hypothetical protein WC139_07225 [Candidatus Kapaibacterium sp.]